MTETLQECDRFMETNTGRRVIIFLKLEGKKNRVDYSWTLDIDIDSILDIHDITDIDSILDIHDIIDIGSILDMHDIIDIGSILDIHDISSILNIHGLSLDSEQTLDIN